MLCADLVTRLLRAMVAKDLVTASSLIAADVDGFVTDGDTGPVDRTGLIAWFERYFAETGAVRLDLGTVVQGTPTSVGARVVHTAFEPFGGPPPVDPPPGPWCRFLPTAVVANCDAAGTALTRFYFMVDTAPPDRRQRMLDAVTAWYAAYMNHDVTGFLAGLADDSLSFNYNAYQPDTPVTKAHYQTGFKAWCAANTKGAFSVTGATVGLDWVTLEAQFLTRAVATGQQKMTHEIHCMRLNDRMQVNRAYFYEIDSCGYPSMPCAW